MLWEAMVKALIKPRKAISTALLTPAERVTYSIRRAGRLVRHTLSLENPFWLFLVTAPSFMMWTQTLRTCFVIFPGTGLSLTSWSFPRFPFLPFFFEGSNLSPVIRNHSWLLWLSRDEKVCPCSDIGHHPQHPYVHPLWSHGVVCTQLCGP